MRKEIQKCMCWLVNKLSEANSYESWSNEFKAKENKKAFDKFNEEMRKHIDFNKLTIEEARELGFVVFNGNIPNLYLIPLYLVPMLPNGLEVTCISGEKKFVGNDYIDKDIRFGCIAYGVEIFD